jgi:hypothetical protein
MTRLAVPAKARPALVAFMKRCLDPLPTAVLVDTEYNLLMRKARKDKWNVNRACMDTQRRGWISTIANACGSGNTVATANGKNRRETSARNGFLYTGKPSPLWCELLPLMPLP